MQSLMRSAQSTGHSAQSSRDRACWHTVEVIWTTIAAKFCQPQSECSYTVNFASRRLIPHVVELNSRWWKQRGICLSGRPWQIPITVNNLVSVGLPVFVEGGDRDSSRPFAFAVHSNHRCCYKTRRPRAAPSPALWTGRWIRVSHPCRDGACAIAFCNIMMFAGTFDPFFTVTTTGANDPEGTTCVGRTVRRPRTPPASIASTTLAATTGRWFATSDHQLAQIEKTSSAGITGAPPVIASPFSNPHITIYDVCPHCHETP